MESQGQKLWRQVEAEEKSHIRARRDERRDPQDPIVGLAISGGGIRSATFALGVLETLKQLGVLQKVDYLSTVSGGGYVGAWLTAGCWRRPGLGRDVAAEAFGALGLTSRQVATLLAAEREAAQTQDLVAPVAPRSSKAPASVPVRIHPPLNA